MNNEPDIEKLLLEEKTNINTLFENQLKLLTAYKVNLELFAAYVKREENEHVTDIKSFNTKNKIITRGSDLNEVFMNFSNEIIKKSEEFQERGSGSALPRLQYLEINFNKYNPLKASSYIELPSRIKSTKAVVNIQNNDDMCFAWSIVAALNPTTRNPQRTTSYPHYSEVLKLDDIEFPMSLSKIKNFEELNNISVNVYGHEKGIIIGPLYYTKNKKEIHVNLLYIENEEKGHYCLIKNINRLVSSSYSKHHETKWICDGCLLFFSNEHKLRDHELNSCNKIRTFLPKELDNILEFKNFGKQIKVPFIIYADFESILKSIDSCSPSNTFSFTQQTHLHEPFSFSYYIKCDFDASLNKFELYRGPECVKKFMKMMQLEAERIYHILNNIIPMTKLTITEMNSFLKAKKCHICEKELGDDKVHDHDHLTGKFRGAAHSNCNLQYQQPKFIPIVFHNLSGYDSHFIIRELSNEKVDIIPSSMEKYISFTRYIQIDENSYIKLRFIDSFRFLQSSLDNLASNLDDCQLECVRDFFPNEQEFQFMRYKGIFPYEYVDDIKKLDDTSLPPKEKFYSSLNSETIHDSDYIRAQKIWEKFKIQNLGEYSDLYLKTDVLLLADIFENFRKVCMSTYYLDPAHYYTLPGLSWDAMLKITNVQLELFTDIDMHNFVKHSVRGGLCQCVKKISIANNKYITNYDSSKESKYLIYLDANNLYGWAMSQCLPIKNFRWLTKSEIENLDIQNIDDFNEKGYILEVDLEYSYDLHSDHNELPFCVENIVPPYKNSIYKKLVPNLNDKTNYITHYRNLKQCLEHGLKFKKINRVLEFEQSPWLKTYIDLNNNLRTNAVNNFEKDFYKLMNNSVFGKTMENVDKRKDVRILTKWTDKGKKICTERLINMPNFHSSSVIDENLVIIRMNRVKVTYDKPIYIGFSILEISKILMYNFHYDYIKAQYKNKAQLLYMDTDSFIYEIITKDLYQDIKNNIDKFDTSAYDINNVFGIPRVNKKVLGKFKDECVGDIILKFIGLKSKTYCIITKNEIIKKIKGIKKNVVQYDITPDEFENCINDNSLQIRKKMFVIRSNKHILYTELVNKIALENNDDKRFIIPNDELNSLAWGHKEINNFYFL